ncbi:MAG: hypothetical protein AAB413_02905 [Patescibacteria group bacterium]
MRTIATRRSQDTEYEMRDEMGIHEAIMSAHELEARVAERYATGRRHEVDEDPARFQPTYICPQGG